MFPWIESVYVSSILTFWLLILSMMRHCTAYGCSNRGNKEGWENLLWHKHRSKYCSCYMARAGTTEHLNMLFFGKKYAFGGMFPRTICLSSLLSLLIMTQMPLFRALSHGNRWTAGSTIITAIHSPLMPSSDVTTRKPGSDFDWSIISLLHNYAEF